VGDLRLSSYRFLLVLVAYFQFLVDNRISYEFNCIFMIFWRKKLIVHK
jgi:hypothetical protein